MATPADVTQPEVKDLHRHRYFEKRFPRLFLTCYAFALARLASEVSLGEYFPPVAGTLMAPFFAEERTAQVRELRVLTFVLLQLFSQHREQHLHILGQ